MDGIRPREGEGIFTFVRFCVSDWSWWRDNQPSN
ncbi:MAG: hypothetical protein RL215_2615, partial [Planctomycetota bacterium]